MRQTTRSRNLATQSRLTPWITLTAKQANPMENSYGGNPYGKNQKRDRGGLPRLAPYHPQCDQPRKQHKLPNALVHSRCTQGRTLHSGTG